MQQPKPTFQFVFIFMVATAIVLYGCEKEEPMPHMTIYLPTDTTSTPQLWPTHIQIVNAADMHPISGADVYLYCDYESWFGDEVTGPPLLHKISDSDGMVHWNDSDAVVQICAEADGFWGECGSSGSYLYSSGIIDGIYKKGPFAWLHISIVDDYPYNPEIYFYASGYVNQQSPIYIHSSSAVLLDWIGDVDRELRLAAKTSYYQPPLYWDTLHLTAPSWDTLYFEYHY